MQWKGTLFLKAKDDSTKVSWWYNYVNVLINSNCTPYWLSLLIGWSMFKAASIGTCCFYTNHWEMKMYVIACSEFIGLPVKHVVNSK